MLAFQQSRRRGSWPPEMSSVGLWSALHLTPALPHLQCSAASSWERGPKVAFLGGTLQKKTSFLYPPHAERCRGMWRMDFGLR